MSSAAIGNQAEQRRQMVKDFQDIFGTPKGVRVWERIRDDICFYNRQTPVPSPSGMPTGDTALYHCGRRDVAAAIFAILTTEFKNEEPPVVRTRRAEEFRDANA